MRGKPIQYTDAELRWVKKNSHRARSEMAERFAVKFNRNDVTAEHLKQLCTRKGWSAGPGARARNRGKSQIFTTAQVEWIKGNAALPRTEVHAAFCTAFPETEITAQQIIAYRKRNKIRTGRSGQFKKGHRPWSAGRKIGSSPNSQRTQFKPGQRAPNHMPIGTERMRDDGYMEIKVDQRNPYTGAQGWFVFKHKYLWEQENGPVPEGHGLKCLDGDRTNCDPSNWIPLPRNILVRLNGKCGRKYDQAPPELKPTIMLIAKLEQAARDAADKTAKRDDQPAS